MAHLRTVLTMLGLLFAAVAIAAPAAARKAHELNHLTSPVASSQHHHHDKNGRVTTHGAGHDADPRSDELPSSPFGHSHVASTAFDIVPGPPAVLVSTMILPDESLPAANTPVLGTLGWSPQKRPPRTA